MTTAITLKFATSMVLYIQLLMLIYLYSAHRVRFFCYLVWAWSLFVIAKASYMTQQFFPEATGVLPFFDAAGSAGDLLILAAGLAYRWGYRLRWYHAVAGIAYALAAVLLSADVGAGMTLVRRLVSGTALVAAGMAFWPRPAVARAPRGAKLLSIALSLWGVQRLVMISVEAPPGSSEIPPRAAGRRGGPVGSNQPQTVDVRVLAATNRDLGQLMQQGKFREDLFYRLNVIPVTIPPLRERREDIPALAEHFLQRLGRKQGRTLRLTAAAVERLLCYPWPGNVHELENTMERAAILDHNETFGPEDLPSHIAAGTPPSAPLSLPREQTLAEIEKAHILHTLERFGWNHSRAAEALGIGRTSLWRKLKEYQIAENSTP